MPQRRRPGQARREIAGLNTPPGYVAEMKSLIQQRMVFDRERAKGMAVCSSGVIFLLLAALQLATNGSLPWWIFFAGGLGIVVSGIVILVRNQRELKAFELEHGANAGKQKTIQ
jgi:ABC-type nickel/cobalt efflux system permease component RcnA